MSGRKAVSMTCLDLVIDFENQICFQLMNFIVSGSHLKICWEGRNLNSCFIRLWDKVSFFYFLAFFFFFFWLLWSCLHSVAFPGSSVVKNLPDNAGDVGDTGLISGSGRSSGEGNGKPLQLLLPGKSHAQRSLVGHSPWGHRVRQDLPTILQQQQ